MSPREILTNMASGDEKLIGAYIERLRQKGRRARTRQEYARRLRQLSIHLPDGLDNATPDDLLEWRAGLTLCDNTVVAYCNTVRGFYAWMERSGRVPEAPTKDLPVPPARKGVPRPIGEDDLDYAIDNAPDRVRPWLVLAAYEGLRAQEIAYLRREDLLNTHRPPMLHVSEEMAKGGREDVIPLVPYVWAELQAYGLPRRGYVFKRLRGSGPNRPATVSNVANAYLHDIGIDETLHQLRHHFGTSVLETAGGNLRVAQDLLRHRSLATTAIYTAIRPREALAAALAIQPAERRRRRAAEDLPDDAA